MTASQMNTSEKMNATTVCQVYTVPTKANHTYLRKAGGKPLECPCFL